MANPIQTGDKLAFAWPDGEYILADNVEDFDDITKALGYQKSDDFLTITGSTTISEISHQMGKHSIDLLSELMDYF